MNRYNLNLSTSPQLQPTRKLRSFANLAHYQRLVYRKTLGYHTGKELDSETGLYYYGARYLDPKTSRWLSGDPAMGEYIPSAPVNDEARKRNGSLPGMGGVFNYVNLHVYHYAGNNPVKYVDPDGRLFDDLIETVQNHIENFQQATLEKLSDVFNKEGDTLLQGVHSGRLALGSKLFDIGAASVSLNFIGEYDGNIRILAEIGADWTLVGHTIDGRGAKITIGLRQSLVLWDKDNGGPISPNNFVSRITNLNLAVDATARISNDFGMSLQIRKFLFNFSSLTSNESVSIGKAVKDIFLKDLVIGAQFYCGSLKPAYRLNVSNWLGYDR